LKFHPATLLSLWGGFAILTQSLGLLWLGWIALAAVPLCLIYAGKRALLLLRRARWLLLSIVLLFLFGTPGERLPGTIGAIGATYDGLTAATEQLLRLVLLLVTLAWLHLSVGSSGLVRGLHWLLSPLAAWGDYRERIVVRLLLVLENVENDLRVSWQHWLLPAPENGPDHMTLTVAPVRWPDWLVLAGLIVFAGWLGWWR
jgi:hypothetical protein